MHRYRLSNHEQQSLFLLETSQALSVDRRRDAYPSFEGASETTLIGKAQFVGHVARVMPLLQERSRRALESTLVQHAKRR